MYAVPVLTACILLYMGVPYNHWRTSSIDRTPTYVLVAPAAIDVRLNWTSPTFEAEDPPRVLINPTLLLVETEGGGAPKLMRAARAHSTIFTAGIGSWWVNEENATISVTEMTTTWRSDIVMAMETNASSRVRRWNGWDVTAWGLDGIQPLLTSSTGHLTSSLNTNKWGPLCEPKPLFIPHNATLFKKAVTGPEDPKLMMLPDGGVAMSFSSLPPVESRPGCHHSNGAVVQMYLSAALEPPHAEASVGVRLGCGSETTAEKNWISFVYDGQLYYIYSIHPHVVVQVRPADGVCVRRYSTSSYQPLAKLYETGRYQIHGSATATMHNGTYLALLHTVDNVGMYATMAYRFQATPPFAILAVSRPIPLQGAGGANFASGLLLPSDSDKVVVTYGAADLESRALVMSLHFLETLFSPVNCT